MKLSKEKIEKINELAKQGETFANISKELNINRVTVTKYAKYKRTPKYSENICLADYNEDARRKLTKEDLKELAELFEQHRYTDTELARMFHVSPTTIRYHRDPEYRKKTNEASARRQMLHYDLSKSHKESVLRTYYKKKNIAESIKTSHEIRLVKQMTERRIARHVYKVIGTVNAFTNDELIDFCDICNFGGIVHRYSDNCAEVEVYID